MRILRLLLWGTIVILCAELAVVIWVELSGYLDADALIYFAVGRGILNHLVPYRDLFETKPPGIFLLAALSLKFGGVLLGKIVQVLALLCIPLCIVLPARSILHNRNEEIRALLLHASAAIGLLLTLFTALFSGGFQVESMGAAATCCYVALVATKRDGWGWQRTLLGGLTIFIAVFLKEPFILTALACALILARSTRALVSVFLLPAIVAGTIDGATLLLLGYLGPYLFYLQFMVEHHTNLYNGPLLLRALYLGRFAANAWLFSPLLPFLLALLIGTAAWRAWGERRSRILCIVAAVYLLFLAVAMGGDFYIHHFVFAVPGYAALLLALLAGEMHETKLSRPITVLLLMTIAVSLWHVRENPARKIREWAAWDGTLRTAAETIDTAMDRCGIDRYLYLVTKGGGPFGYTRHSPIGPVFINHNRFVMQDHSPLTGVFAEEIKHADLIVLEREDETGMTRKGLEYLQTHFTDLPPVCAGDIHDSLPYHLLFRLAEQT